MACGTPVIVYDCTALPEAVNNQCGFVVKEHDLKSVVDCIKKASNIFEQSKIVDGVIKYSKQQMANNYICVSSIRGSFRGRPQVRPPVPCCSPAGTAARCCPTGLPAPAFFVSQSGNMGGSSAGRAWVIGQIIFAKGAGLLIQRRNTNDLSRQCNAKRHPHTQHSLTFLHYTSPPVFSPWHHSNSISFR